MTVRYHSRCTQPVPDYVCQRDGIEHGKPICQSINGEQIDETIRELLIETMTPMALDVALAVQQQIQTRLDDVDRLRRKQVERARYEADQAQRRYMHVDPANRLVADTLEAEWNSKLRALNEAQQEYERLRQTDHLAVDETQRARIAALAGDFPRLWQDPKTPDREKKRMVRLLLEDVTLLKGDQIHVHVRFKGGVLKSLSLPLPLGAPLLRKTPVAVVSEVDRLFAGEGQEARVEAHQAAIMFGHGRGQVVIENFPAHAVESRKGMDVATHEGLKTLAVSELQIRHPAVPIDQREGIQFALVAFVAESAEVTPVHLEAFAGLGFHTHEGALGCGCGRTLWM
jgi:hypothetical protein